MLKANAKRFKVYFGQFVNGEGCKNRIFIAYLLRFFCRVTWLLKVRFKISALIKRHGSRIVL